MPRGIFTSHRGGSSMDIINIIFKKNNHIDMQVDMLKRGCGHVFSGLLQLKGITTYKAHLQQSSKCPLTLIRVSSSPTLASKIVRWLFTITSL